VFACLKLHSAMLVQKATKGRTTSMRPADFLTDSMTQTLHCQCMSLPTAFAPIFHSSLFSIDCPVIPLGDCIAQHLIIVIYGHLYAKDTILFPQSMQPHQGSLKSGSSQCHGDISIDHYQDFYESVYLVILNSSVNLSTGKRLNRYFSFILKS